MPQGDHIELHRKRFGQKFDHAERVRKREAREVHKRSERAQSVFGLKAKRTSQERFKEKVQMKKTLAQHAERLAKKKKEKQDPGEALPAYLLDRERQERSRVLTNMLKQKRKARAGRWDVPLARVKPITEEEMFRVVKSGKRMKKGWKRMVTKPTFVGNGFTRKPAKYERFIRPAALRFRQAHVTHPELNSTFKLNIIGVKKNPSSHLYTELGVLTQGTIIEVDVSDLGLVTQSGKVVWGKYAQISNHPDRDGCINGIMLV